MPLFLDTTGESTLGIALCGRCSFKFPLSQLYPDPNTPGLMVCREDLDVLDPYRLPPRPEDVIVLPFVRPDVSVAVTAADVTVTTDTPYTFWQADFWNTDVWATGFWS